MKFTSREGRSATAVYLQILALVLFACASIYFIESQFSASESSSLEQEQQAKTRLSELLKSKHMKAERFNQNPSYGWRDPDAPKETPAPKVAEEKGSGNGGDLISTIQQKKQAPKETPAPKVAEEKGSGNGGDLISIIQQKKQAYNPPRITEASCVHTIKRDYKKDPVKFAGMDQQSMKCDVPCERGSTDIGAGKSCSHVKRYDRTMENIGRWIGDDHTIAGNTHRDSDVHIQYYSWAEYDFMRPAIEKTADVPMVALISNCGPQYRLSYMKELMDAGIKIDSFGACMNNKGSSNHLGEGRLQSKQDGIIPKYKFTMSFENSETEDYVTEKLFGPLVAGSIPIYHGAPNGKVYAPNNHSVIFANDFAGPKELAAYLKELDKNDTAYKEYLTWKKDGPTTDWIAVIDSSIVHSNCRFCIRSADIDRKNIGEVETGPFWEENQKEMSDYENKNALMLKVRERGKFYLRRIHLEKLTYDEVIEKLKSKWNNAELGEVHGFYKLWDRKKEYIKTDAGVRDLAYGEEIELIFEYPGNPERHGYTEWYRKNKA